MDIYTFLYLADKVDSFSVFFTILGIIGSILFTLITLEMCMNSPDNLKLKGLSILTTLVFYTFIGIGVLIPSSNFMYQAGAVYLGKQIIKNEQVQETFDKVKKVIDLNLDKQIKELNGDKN